MIRTEFISLVLILFAAIPYSVTIHAQDVSALMRQAALLERNFKDEQALQKYLEVIKSDPANLVALCKASELYSIVGKRQPTKEKQKEYYKKGLELARKAIKINPDNSDANFAMAISMGRTALISSGEEKIRAVRDIKIYADKCVKIDPSNFKGYHILGKWHYEVSDLSSLERWLVKVTYGALPASSMDEAIRNYDKSRKLNPAFLLNYLEVAKAYKKKGETKKARALIEQMLKLPHTTSDDPKIKSLGRKLLDEL